jgi:hypothetical protein
MKERIPVQVSCGENPLTPLLIGLQGNQITDKKTKGEKMEKSTQLYALL